MQLKDIGHPVRKNTSIGPLGDDERDTLVYNSAIDDFESLEVVFDEQELAKRLYQKSLIKDGGRS